MCVLRKIGKILVFPVMLIVTVIWYMFDLVTKISSIVFRLLSVITLLITAVALIMGVMPWHEAPKLLLTWIIAFVIPIIAESTARFLYIALRGLTGYIQH